MYGRYTGDTREMYLEEVDDAHGVERERVPYLLLDPLAGAHVDRHAREGALALLVLDRLLAQLVLGLRAADDLACRADLQLRIERHLPAPPQHLVRVRVGVGVRVRIRVRVGVRGRVRVTGPRRATVPC